MLLYKYTEGKFNMSKAAIKDYSMYVDESYDVLFFGDKKYHFMTLSGIIVDPELANKINFEINNYKEKTFGNTDVVLHAKDISLILKYITSESTKNEFEKRANNIYAKQPEYSVYQGIGKIGEYFNLISNLLSSKPLLNAKIISTTFNMDSYRNFYGVSENEAHIKLLDKILENYMHFLQSEHATGNIIFEDSSHEDNYKKRFNSFIANGSPIYTAKKTRSTISSLTFIDKFENNNILQFIDPLPAAILHHDIVSIKESLQIKNPNMKNPTTRSSNNDFIKYSNISKHFYDGNVNRSDIFGKFIWNYI